VIGYNITAQPPVLSPSSILPPLSSHCPFIPATKIQRALKFIFDFFVKNGMSTSVCALLYGKQTLGLTNQWFGCDLVVTVFQDDENLQ
jgi:hypothetical protein